MRQERGFTLIEMVMVMLIIAILSVFASAKAGLFSGWKEAGAAQMIPVLIGSAQELAVANRATVFLAFSSSAISACYDAACANPCRNIDGTALSISAPSGQFEYTSSSFSFDAQGRPSFLAPFTISYNGQSTTIQPETGAI